MTHPSLSLSDVFIGPTPNTPDLGCLVRRVHDLEEDFAFHAWPELSSVASERHQAYFRVRCGDAGFFQRCLISMHPPGTDLAFVLGLPPDEVLGGDFRPTPSDWVKFSPQTSAKEYWLVGEHRDPAFGSWKPDEHVGHSFEIYENGTLSTVGFDDTGTDLDFNDFVVDVAIVRRSTHFDRFVRVEVSEAVAESASSAVTQWSREHSDRHRIAEPEVG